MLLSRAQVQQLLNNLLELGPRRLMALGLIGFAVLVTVVGGAYYLSRPEFETLYTGLSREDVTRMGAALREQNITFDVNTAGDAVSVRPSQTMQARMLLAEKGLPTSANSGYELFDKIGSLGLTSFMQEVTKLRALEGEIARTVQLMKGVKAARVHIVIAGAGVVPRDAAAAFGIGRAAHRRRNRGTHGAVDPSSRRGGHSGHESRQGHGAGRRRFDAACRRG
ncbi:flagellar biosynthesis/type III secretory pathway M-ring protein FliF/YscJ [Bradyrhizobium sp. F1.13.4]